MRKLLQTHQRTTVWKNFLQRKLPLRSRLLLAKTVMKMEPQTRRSHPKLIPRMKISWPVPRVQSTHPKVRQRPSLTTLHGRQQLQNQGAGGPVLPLLQHLLLLTLSDHAHPLVYLARQMWRRPLRTYGDHQCRLMLLPRLGLQLMLSWMLLPMICGAHQCLTALQIQLLLSLPPSFGASRTVKRMSSLPLLLRSLLLKAAPAPAAPLHSEPQWRLRISKVASPPQGGPHLMRRQPLQTLSSPTQGRQLRQQMHSTPQAKWPALATHSTVQQQVESPTTLPLLQKRLPVISSLLPQQLRSCGARSRCLQMMASRLRQAPRRTRWMKQLQCCGGRSLSWHAPTAERRS
mmetsp:Transcript_46137/g.109758  ORF Transcript_46137/g.109758 Transcript_46137/m.109758 type:complete len:346 (-) Transcript_46137:182-1219(-)